MAENPAPDAKHDDPAGPPAKQLKPRLRFRLKMESSVFGQIFGAVKSDEPKTRRMSYQFLFGIVGSLVCIALLAKQSIDRRFKQIAEREVIEKAYAKRKAETSATARDAFRFNLGIFTFDLKTPASQPRPHGVQGIAQAEIYIECDEEKTCEYVKGHVDIVRDRVMAVLVSLTQEDLLSTDGKKRVRERILQSINQTLGEGKITGVNFTKLLAS